MDWEQNWKLNISKKYGVGDDLPSERLHFVKLLMERFWGFLYNIFFRSI